MSPRYFPLPVSVRIALLAAALVGCMAMLAACQPKAGAAAGGAPMGPPPVSVAAAVQKDVQEFDEFTGRLEPTETVDLRPRISGYIDKVNFREGQDVRKGDLLFTVDAGPARAELARAQAQLVAARTQGTLAKTEGARGQKLLDLKAIAQQEYDQLIAGQQNGEANIKAAEAAVAAAQLNVGYADIRAPISGRISRANVTAGNLVNVGDPVLTTIVSQAKVYAYFDASEDTYLKYVRAVRDGTGAGSKTAPTAVMMGLANETGFPHKGSIDFVDNRLNPQTGAIRVRAVFDNPDRRFTPGLFARLQLVGTGTYSAVLTPDRAIGTDQNKKFVYVIGEGNVAQFREVKPGALINGMRVITSGLKAGELVVVSGLQRVRPGTPVTPEKLDVDANGMPIEKPAPPPGTPGEKKAGLDSSIARG